MQSTMHVYEVRPRKDKRGVDLISDALPFRIAPESFLIATQMTRPSGFAEIFSDDFPGFHLDFARIVT